MCVYKTMFHWQEDFCASPGVSGGKEGEGKFTGCKSQQLLHKLMLARIETHLLSTAEHDTAALQPLRSRLGEGEGNYLSTRGHCFTYSKRDTFNFHGIEIDHGDNVMCVLPLYTMMHVFHMSCLCAVRIHISKTVTGPVHHHRLNENMLKRLDSMWWE